MLSTKIWLEANTERSESNPGRSLGITNNSWRAVWKTVPHDMLACLRLARHVQNQSRITPMRRICSSLILFLCELICAFTALWFIRIFSCWSLSAPYRRKKKSGKNQDQVYLRFRKSVKKIKSVASVLSVSHFERVRTEPKAKEHYNVVLSSRQPISACL